MNRLANDGLGLGAAEAIHEPDGGLVLAGVNPEEVVAAVAVEVAAALELPLGVGLLVGELCSFFDGGVFEVPGDDFSGVAVVPEEVVGVVGVEVAGAGEVPGAIGDGREGDAVGDLGAVHQPEEVLAGGGVAPGEVGFAIVIEVSGGLDLPVAVVDGGADGDRCGGLGAFHQVDEGLAGAGVAPDEVWAVVTVEVVLSFVGFVVADVQCVEDGGSLDWSVVVEDKGGLGVDAGAVGEVGFGLDAVADEALARASGVVGGKEALVLIRDWVAGGGVDGDEGPGDGATGGV